MANRLPSRQSFANLVWGGGPALDRLPNGNKPVSTCDDKEPHCSDSLPRNAGHGLFFVIAAQLRRHNAYPQIPPAAHHDLSANPAYGPKLPEGIDCQRCHGPGAAHVKFLETLNDFI